MRFTTTRVALLIVGAIALTSARDAAAAIVSWNVDSAASFVRLNIPDFAYNADGTNITVRIRDSNNNAWSDNGGRRAFLGGTINTNYTDGSSIQFNTLASELYALEGTNLRPNPAAFDPNATNADNPDGSYVNTSSAPAALGAKVRASATIVIPVTLDAAYIAFRDAFASLQSGVIALGGGSTIAGGTTDFGIASANLDVDGLSITLVGQILPDMANEPLSLGVEQNLGAGAITIPDPVNNPLLRRLQLAVNVPLAIDLDGIIINASAVGQIVAFATVPEPSTMLMAGFAAFGLLYAGRRRFRRS